LPAQPGPASSSAIDDGGTSEPVGLQQLMAKDGTSRDRHVHFGLSSPPVPRRCHLDLGGLTSSPRRVAEHDLDRETLSAKV
jgi:hypothetical protein